MSKSKYRLRCLLIVLINSVLVFSYLFWSPKSIYAVTNISYGPSGSTVGTYVSASQNNFTLFTPVVALLSGSTITLTFPTGTTLNSSNLATSDFRISQGTSGACVNSGTDTAPTNINVNSSNRTIVFTLSSGSLSKTVLSVVCGLGDVTIKTSGTFSGNEIRHPTTVTTSGTYQIDTSVIDTGTINTVSFVHDTASQLTFTTQPSSTGTAGNNLSTQPVVTIQDQYGNTATSNTNSITLAAVLSSDNTTPGTGILNATSNPLSAVSGVATFAGINYTKAESIKLKATSSGLTEGISSSISISANTPTQLTFTTQPSSAGTAGNNLSTQPVVTIQDQYGNTVTSSSSQITLSVVLSQDGVTPGLGTLSATTNPLSASSGIATFAGINYTKAESIKLKATSSGLAESLSQAINISAGAVSLLSKVSGDTQTDYSYQPLDNPFVITAYDDYSNVVSGANISFSINSSPTNATGQTLSTTLVSTDSNGQASSILTLGSKRGLYTVLVSSTGANNLTFSATALSSPLISTITPSGVGLRAINKNITITGTDFMENPTVNFTDNGVTINSVTFNSSTEIVLNINVDSDTQVGAKSFSITNTDTGAVQSTLTINPKPTISGISTKRLDQGDIAEITIDGQNLNVSSIDIGSQINVTEINNVTDKKITAKVTVSQIAQRGRRDFTIINNDGGRSQGESVVIAPPLSISNLNIYITGPDSAHISWYTDQETTSFVSYGLSKKYGKKTESSRGKYHQTTLYGLVPNWVHFLQITNQDEYSQVVTKEEIFTANIINSTPTPTLFSSITNPPVSQSPTDPTTTATPFNYPSQDLVDLKIKVLDQDGKPLANTVVEIHSTPRITTTDENGIATFPKVEKGDHTLYIAYAEYRGEQKFQVKGASTDTEGKAIDNLTVEVTPSLTAKGSWKWILLTIVSGFLSGFLGTTITLKIAKKLRPSPIEPIYFKRL